MTNIDDELRGILGSTTAQSLSKALLTLPDKHNRESLKCGYVVCLVDLITALDEDRIEFKNQNDKAMFYGLLTLALNEVLPAGYVEKRNLQ